MAQAAPAPTRKEVHLFPGTQARVDTAALTGATQLGLNFYVSDAKKAQTYLNGAAFRTTLVKNYKHLGYQRFFIQIILVGEFEAHLTFNSRPDWCDFDDGYLRSQTISTNLAVFRRTTPSEGTTRREGTFFCDPACLSAPYTQYNLEIVVILETGDSNVQAFEWEALRKMTTEHDSRGVSIFLPEKGKVPTPDVNVQVEGFTFRATLEVRSRHKPALGYFNSLHIKHIYENPPPIADRRYPIPQQEWRNMYIRRMVFVGPGQQVNVDEVPSHLIRVYLHLFYLYVTGQEMNVQPLDHLLALTTGTNKIIEQIVIHRMVRMVFHPFADFIPGICPEVQLLYYPE